MAMTGARVGRAIAGGAEDFGRILLQTAMLDREREEAESRKQAQALQTRLQLESLGYTASPELSTMTSPLPQNDVGRALIAAAQDGGAPDGGPTSPLGVEALAGPDVRREAPKPRLDPARYDPSAVEFGGQQFYRERPEYRAQQEQQQAIARARQLAEIQQQVQEQALAGRASRLDEILADGIQPGERGSALAYGVPGSQVFPEPALRTPSPYQFVQGKDGRIYVANPNTGALSLAAGGPSQGSPGPDIRNLPSEVQRGIAAVPGARAALDNYRELLNSYLSSTNIAGRGAAAIGLPDKQRDAVLGQLETARNSLMLQIKELARLGVLSGPDMQIMQDMIGDPTSPGTIIRDPAYLTGKLDQIEKMLADLERGTRTAYGMSGPGFNLSQNSSPRYSPDNPFANR